MPATELTSEEQQIVRDALAQLEEMSDTIAGFEERIMRLEQQHGLKQPLGSR